MTRAFNTRLVIKTQGALLLIESVFMAIATAVSSFYDDPDDGAFLISTLLTLTAGLWGLFIGRKADSRVGEREGYVIVRRTGDEGQRIRTGTVPLPPLRPEGGSAEGEDGHAHQDL